MISRSAENSPAFRNLRPKRTIPPERQTLTASGQPHPFAPRADALFFSPVFVILILGLFWRRGALPALLRHLSEATLFQRFYLL